MLNLSLLVEDGCATIGATVSIVTAGYNADRGGSDHRTAVRNSGSRVNGMNSNRGSTDGHGRSGMNSYGGGSDNSPSESSTTETGATVRVLGVVDVVLASSGVDELNLGGGGLATDNLNDASSGASGPLYIKLLDSLTVDNTLNMGSTRIVVDNTDVVLLTGNNNLTDLGRGLGSFVNTDDLVSSLEVLNPDGLTTRASVDLVGADSSSRGVANNTKINWGSSDSDGRGRCDLNSRGGGYMSDGRSSCDVDSRSGRDIRSPHVRNSWGGI